MTTIARLMHHDRDPAEAIREAVGDLSEFQLLFNQVLVGIYVRPEKTKGGIILADQTRHEDVYQGKSALVLAKGPTAFMDDDPVRFHGQNIEVGQWVVFRPSDGWPITIRGTTCRIVQDVHIRATIPAPDLIY